MTGIDTNVLVALSAPFHPQRDAVSRVLADELNRRETLAFTSGVAAEFLHVISDPRRFQPELPMSSAVDWLAAWASTAGVVCIPSTEGALQQWLEWQKAFRLGRKRILDTQLAATLHTAGVRRLVTSNPDDFCVFGVFELIVP